EIRAAAAEAVPHLSRHALLQGQESLQDRLFGGDRLPGKRGGRSARGALRPSWRAGLRRRRALAPATRKSRAVSQAGRRRENRPRAAEAARRADEEGFQDRIVGGLEARPARFSARSPAR